MNPKPLDPSLRLIYMGTPEFAVPALELLSAAGANLVAVITAPDKPQGRGQQLEASPVKKAAEKLGIPVLQPSNLKDPDFLHTLKELKADLQIVVAFRMLPEAVWNMPPLGTFNLHASLLPNFRGAAPINWALIQGEKETGVTTFFLQHQIDTGDILFQEKISIRPEDNLGSLYEKLKKLGADLVVKTVDAIARKEVHPMAQDESKAVYQAPKIFKETCAIDWKASSTSIHHLVRGLSPYPGAFTLLQGKTCKIFTSAPLSSSLPGKAPGEWCSDFKTYLHFQCGQGTLSVIELQLEGKKRMKIDEFLRGWKEGNPTNSG
ncbi:MAG: hypothetical protein RL407_818 [Bacteroidota bacterium]